MLKRCQNCSRDLPLSEFSKHRAGLYHKCKSCNRAYQRAHYAAHKADYIAKAAAWKRGYRERSTKLLIEYLASHPCVDCGETDPVVLQFDHVRGEKANEVSVMLSWSVGWARILAEIEKCEVRCANCHWRRHASERRWQKAMTAPWQAVLSAADDDSHAVKTLRSDGRGRGYD